MSKHEKTIEGHVDSNVDFAIESAGECGGLENAFWSFMQNTVDSCVEDGYSADDAFEAGNWFCSKFNAKTGLGL